jgi:hypothetical protein
MIATAAFNGNRLEPGLRILELTSSSTPGSSQVMTAVALFFQCRRKFGTNPKTGEVPRKLSTLDNECSEYNLQVASFATTQAKA